MIPLALAALSAPPSDAVQTLELALLPWTRALALRGQIVRLRLVVLNGPVWDDGGTVLVEAEGPQHESRTVRIWGARWLKVDAGDVLTVEGMVRVVWHRSTGEFPGFVELRVGGRWSGKGVDMGRNRLPESDDGLPTVDECADCLRRAGWSCGDFATAGGWVVSARNGENAIEVKGPKRELTWRRAVEVARAVGMLR
jgi:hypothetical protein